MTEKEKLTKKLKLVTMNEVDISTEENPIIGTQALSTCVGMLLYSEVKKKAIVAHFSVEWESLVVPMLELIFDNGLNDDDLKIKYYIIPGYYEEHYKVKNSLEKVCRSLHPTFIPFDEKEIPSNAVEKDGDLPAYRFAFDASAGKFITDKVLYGLDYLKVCKDIPNKKRI